MNATSIRPVLFYTVIPGADPEAWDGAKAPRLLGVAEFVGRLYYGTIVPLYTPLTLSLSQVGREWMRPGECRGCWTDLALARDGLRQAREIHLRHLIRARPHRERLARLARERDRALVELVGGLAQDQARRIRCFTEAVRHVA